MNYDLVAFWSQIAGFVLFAAALIWAVNTWLTPAITAAQKAGNERIALAEKHRDEMRGALDALRGQLDGAQHDAESIRALALDRAKTERDAIISEAREQGERLVRTANGELDRARAAGAVTLREEIADRALAMAKTTVAKGIDNASNARLVDEFVTSLERGGRN